MASPSETTLILLGAGGRGRRHRRRCRQLLAGGDGARADGHAVARQLGRFAARRVDRQSDGSRSMPAPRPARRSFSASAASGGWSPTCWSSMASAYLAVDSDIDGVLAAREAEVTASCSAMSRGPSLVEKLNLGQAAALVLTMDDPVLIVRLARQLARRVSRAADHRPRPRHRPCRPPLPRRGHRRRARKRSRPRCSCRKRCWSTSASPMGPVIASIHEKRSELRAEIMEQGELAEEPTLGRRRLRDAGAKGNAA